MEINKIIIKELAKNIGTENVLENERLADHTTFKIGGSCIALLLPKNENDLISILKILKKYDAKYFIIGRGSNSLFADKGLEKFVIKLSDNIASVELIGQNKIKAFSGISLKELSDFALENSLTGLEFACGIPGALGGGIFMNAGAYISEMKNIVESVRVIDEDLKILELSNEDLKFSYRKSIIQEKPYLIVSSVLKLEKGNKSEIKALIDDLTAKRNEKQPLDMPSAGSVFKRPEGHFAGKLIQDAGLMGTKFGGAMVSTKHAGFIVNTGNATENDLITLVEIIRKTVFDKTGILLEPEVRIIK